jgi:hypothetical protein
MKVLYIVLFCSIFFIAYGYGNWQYESTLKLLHDKYKFNIRGHFLNEEKKQRNEFSLLDEITFLRKKQGESRMTDEIWTFDKHDKVFRISLDKYATYQDDIISIMEEDKVIETMIRKKVDPISAEAPTYDNIEEFSLAHIHYNEFEECEALLEKQKYNACINDWNMPIGPKSNDFMARGAFAIDKKRKFYFFIQPNQLATILHDFKKIKKEEVPVKELSRMRFAGCMA